MATVMPALRAFLSKNHVKLVTMKNLLLKLLLILVLGSWLRLGHTQSPGSAPAFRQADSLLALDQPAAAVRRLWHAALVRELNRKPVERRIRQIMKTVRKQDLRLPQQRQASTEALSPFITAAFRTTLLPTASWMAPTGTFSQRTWVATSLAKTGEPPFSTRPSGGKHPGSGASGGLIRDGRR